MLKPQHINASEDDIKGNNGLGRYILLTGCDSRAFSLSQHFKAVKKLAHPRQHNLYIGSLPTLHGDIDVAAVSSGMGGPSADIIVNELIMLGAKRIFRVGTSGSLQPSKIRVGDVVIPTAAVRDDKASWDYICPEYPAIASLQYVISALRAANELTDSVSVHTGIVHSKSSLYAREMEFSFLVENKQYMNAIKQAGVIASEMECAQLFTLAGLMSCKTPHQPVLAGAVLAIVGDDTPFGNDEALLGKAIESTLKLAIETTKQISYIDKKIKVLY